MLWIIHNLTTGQSTEHKCQWGHIYIYHAPRAQRLLGKRRQNDGKAKGWRVLEQNGVFWSWQDSSHDCLHMTYRRSSQSMWRGTGLGSCYSNRGILDSWWLLMEGWSGFLFCFVFWSMGSWTINYIPLYMSNTNWSQWVINNNKERG